MSSKSEQWAQGDVVWAVDRSSDEVYESRVLWDYGGYLWITGTVLDCVNGTPNTSHTDNGPVRHKCWCHRTEAEAHAQIADRKRARYELAQETMAYAEAQYKHDQTTSELLARIDPQMVEEAKTMKHHNGFPAGEWELVQSLHHARLAMLHQSK